MSRKWMISMYVILCFALKFGTRVHEMIWIKTSVSISPSRRGLGNVVATTIILCTNRTYVAGATAVN